MSASPNTTRLTSFFFAAAVAAVALLAVSHGNIDDTAYGDGLIYRYVASHLTTPPQEIDPVVTVRGTSLRYGRIGFPAMIWLTAAGHNRAMPYSQAILIMLFAGTAGVGASVFLIRAGPIASVIPFLAPGFALSVVGGYGEVPAVAIAIWAVIMVQRERPWLAAGLLGVALLVREDAGVALIGLVVWQLLKRRPKTAFILTTSVIPLIGWYAVVHARYGHIPIFDPFLRVSTRAPVVAVWHSVTEGPAGSVATAAIHVVLALVAFWMWRRSILFVVAAAAGLQVLSSGVLAWEFVGDALRVFTFLQLFLLLGFASLRWGERHTDPHSVGDVLAI